MHIHTHTHTHAHTHTHTHTHTYTHKHICILHIHINTYIHTYTHAAFTKPKAPNTGASESGSHNRGLGVRGKGAEEGVGLDTQVLGLGFRVW